MEASLEKMVFSLSLILIFMSGCSSAMKVRQEQRDKVASSSGLFCEFVSGDDYKDVDVELNFAMARRCDSSKNFSVTSYKSSAEVNGLVYCCGTKASASSSAKPQASAPSAPVAPATNSSSKSSE